MPSLGWEWPFSMFETCLEGRIGQVKRLTKMIRKKRKSKVKFQSEAKTRTIPFSRRFRDEITGICKSNDKNCADQRNVCVCFFLTFSLRLL